MSTVASSSRSPVAIIGNSLEDLQIKMRRNGIANSKEFHYFDISQFYDKEEDSYKWVAWYLSEMRLVITAERVK